eukprot:9759631-Alexandrium_andersonii.AAC.1
MQNGSTHSNLELRRPRNGLNIAPRSSRGVDSAPEALSLSCLSSKLPTFGRCSNSKLPNIGGCLITQFVRNSGIVFNSELR